MRTTFSYAPSSICLPITQQAEEYNKTYKWTIEGAAEINNSYSKQLKNQQLNLNHQPMFN
jgi:hypothetical protein